MGPHPRDHTAGAYTRLGSHAGGRARSCGAVGAEARHFYAFPPAFTAREREARLPAVDRESTVRVPNEPRGHTLRFARVPEPTHRRYTMATVTDAFFSALRPRYSDLLSHVSSAEGFLCDGDSLILGTPKTLNGPKP